MNSFVVRERSKKLAMERVFLLTGFEDSVGRPVHGIFVVEVSPELIRQQMERAAKNKSKQSWDGPVKVSYHPASESQARQIELLHRPATPGQGETEKGQ